MTFTASTKDLALMDRLQFGVDMSVIARVIHEFILTLTLG